MVMDDKTEVPLVFLDDTHITGMRTGATGAIRTKYLANIYITPSISRKYKILPQK